MQKVPGVRGDDVELTQLMEVMIEQLERRDVELRGAVQEEMGRDRERVDIQHSPSRSRRQHFGTIESASR
jgi:hypothetical protein